MGYICLACGNQDTFKGTQDITEYTTQTCLFDNDGCPTDVLDSDCYDSDYGDSEVSSCEECSSDFIRYVDEESELDQIQELIDEGISALDIKQRVDDETLFTGTVKDWKKVMDNE